MVYENKRNGMQAKLIRDNTNREGDGTYVLQYPDGKINSVTASTFKRWWKKADIQPVEESVELVKRTRNVKNNPDIQQLQTYILDKAEKLGYEICSPIKEGYRHRSLKVGGHWAAAMNYTTRSVRLHTRTASLTDITDAPNPDKTERSMLDGIFVFTEFTDRAKQDIDIILKSAYNYQLLKNNKKKESEEKKHGKIQSK